MRSGTGAVITLANGNYVVDSYNWNGERGAVTWGDGSTGITGTISVANSLIGDRGDGLGLNVVALTNGNYVVDSPGWNNQAGAATWVNGSNGTTMDDVNMIDLANSLVGQPGDQGSVATLGGAGPGRLRSRTEITWWRALYGRLRAEIRRSGKARVTWGNGTTGTSGVVSAANSLVGSSSDDSVGSGSSGPIRA